MSASNSSSSNNRSWSSRSRASKSRIRSLAVRTRRNKSPKSRWQPCLTTPTRLTRATARCDENSSSTAMRVHLSVLSGRTNFQCLYSVIKVPPVKSRSVCLFVDFRFSKNRLREAMEVSSPFVSPVRPPQAFAKRSSFETPASVWHALYRSVVKHTQHSTVEAFD